MNQELSTLEIIFFYSGVMYLSYAVTQSFCELITLL